jgi:hypothetical protein
MGCVANGSVIVSLETAFGDGGSMLIQVHATTHNVELMTPTPIATFAQRIPCE